ncbi:MAG: BACON domain-containing protein [Marinilabiliaceae bacterium]|nr:BACON domain-containing protein [Marinilabiliaceae bacterium]
MKKFNLLVAFCAIALLFASCDSNDKIDTPSTIITLKVDTEELIFDADDTTPKFVKVTTNATEWSFSVANEASDWLSVEGDDEEEGFWVSVTTNSNEEQRTGKITVAAGDESVTITVIQLFENQTIPIVDTNELEFDFDETTPKFVKVNASTDEWSVIVANAAIDWLSVEIDDEEGGFWVSVTPNTNIEERIGRIDFLSAEESVTIYVTQWGVGVGIFGYYSVFGCGYWDGELNWIATIKKDASDPSKVWLDNFIEGGQNVLIFGIVNEDNTEIRIPFGQITVTYSTGEPRATMNGFHVFYHEDGSVNYDLPREEREIPDGYEMILYVQESEDNITITLPPFYEFGSRVISYEGSWYNIHIPFPIEGLSQWDFDMNRPMITLIKNL